MRKKEAFSRTLSHISVSPFFYKTLWMFHSVVTDEVFFLTAYTITMIPRISKIPPINGKATTKPQDNRRLPNSCKEKRMTKREFCLN